MDDHLVFQALSRRRSASLAALLGVAIFFMTLPAVVAALAVADSSLIQAAWSWIAHATAWLEYLAPAQVILFVPLAAMAVSAEAES